LDYRDNGCLVRFHRVWIRLLLKGNEMIVIEVTAHNGEKRRFESGDGVEYSPMVDNYGKLEVVRYCASHIPGNVVAVFCPPYSYLIIEEE